LIGGPGVLVAVAIGVTTPPQRGMRSPVVLRTGGPPARVACAAIVTELPGPTLAAPACRSQWVEGPPLVTLVGCCGESFRERRSAVSRSLHRLISAMSEVYRRRAQQSCNCPLSQLRTKQIISKK
jgi:hypothetical protein